MATSMNIDLDRLVDIIQTQGYNSVWELLDEDSDDITELLETGSVTKRLPNGRAFVFALVIVEET